MADLSKFEEWKSIYKKPERYDPLTKWLDPTEIEFKTILKIVDFKDKTVLDVGAGTGRLTIPISEIAKKVCAIEPHEDMINYMEKKVVEIDNIEVKRASAEDIPYPDDFFDVVICSWVIQHFKDFKKSFSEMKRVIKKNGILLVVYHNGGDDWEKLTLIEDPNSKGIFKKRYKNVLKELKEFQNVKTKVLDSFITFPNIQIAEKIIRETTGLEAAKYVRENEMLEISNKIFIVYAKK